MFRRIAALMLACALALPAIARAQGHSHGPMPGMRGEAWKVMWDAGEKALELADALPADKFTWRPTKDVRSVSEVLMHIAQANYMFPSMLLGAKAPMDQAAMMKYDTAETDKAKVQKALKDSYDFAKHAMEHMSDAQLEETVDFFGNTITKRMALMILAAHSHEHLGQAVVYARMNKVTPPWTARQNAAMEATKAKGGK